MYLRKPLDEKCSRVDSVHLASHVMLPNKIKSKTKLYMLQDVVCEGQKDRSEGRG